MQYTFDDTARLIFCTLIPFQRSHESNNAILWCMIRFHKRYRNQRKICAQHFRRSEWIPIVSS